MQVENAAFTPLVFGTNGAIDKEATHFNECPKKGTGNSYSDTITYIGKSCLVQYSKLT